MKGLGQTIASHHPGLMDRRDNYSLNARKIKIENLQGRQLKVANCGHNTKEFQ
jgi:hypothetical protein